MNTLRAKIAALIVVSIVAVIGLVSWSMIFAIPVPAFGRIVDLNAYYVSIIVKVGRGATHQAVDDAMSAGEPARFGIKRNAAGGEALEGMTADLRAALRRYDISTPIIVTKTPETFWPVASIAVSDTGWLVLPLFIPAMPPGEVLPLLFGWIVAGTAIVAIFIAYRFMRPLALIEKALANVTSHGELPSLTETGPPDIRATARAINLLSSRLKSAMESRIRLLAAAGHDFRTPMTRLRLRAEFLDEPERQKFLADIDELDHLADSAIRLVHEEVREDNGDALALDILVSDLTVELRELQLDVSLVAAEAVDVIAKPHSLKRALRNLMINAATHGKGAMVIVRRDTRSALIEIVDNGPGIPEALLTRAFEPFYRVHGSHSTVAGTGLGLAIAKEIIQRYQGGLTLANRVGGGLIQTIVMPAVPARNDA